MRHLSYSELRQDLARYMDEAVSNRSPILVAHPQGQGDVVLLSAEEFAGWQETVHLLCSPANAQRLLQSAACADAGKLTERELRAAAPDEARVKVDCAKGKQTP